MKEDCLLQHGIATVTCLLAGIEAFGNGLPSESVLVSIIKGLHGFHIYSKEYWTEYLLELLPSEMGPGYTTSPLFDLAVELATNLNELSTKTEAFSQMLQVSPNGGREPRKFMDVRIGTLQSSLLQIVLNKCLKARSEDQLEAILQGMEAKRQSIDDAATSPIPCPREGVSLILQEYQATIRYVLNQPDYAGVTAAELESFKRYFRDCAYTCRVKGCIRATEGFDRLSQCHEHEILHVRRLRCPHQGCRYPPFVSSRALRAHVNKDHNPTPKSKSIRKMGTTQPNLHGSAAGSPAAVDHTRAQTILNILEPMLPTSNAYLPKLERQAQMMDWMERTDNLTLEHLRNNAGITQHGIQAVTATINAARDSAEATSKLPYLSMTQSAPQPAHKERTPTSRYSSPLPQDPYKSRPAPRGHTTTKVGLRRYEYEEAKLDEAGEQKIAMWGELRGNRAFKCQSFELPDRGSVRFMLALECLFILGYEHTNDLFEENKSLLRITATYGEKEHMVDLDIIPDAFISAEVILVTARSMFRQFGSRLVVNGQVGRDDYWVWDLEDSVAKQDGGREREI